MKGQPRPLARSMEIPRVRMKTAVKAARSFHKAPYQQSFSAVPDRPLFYENRSVCLTACGGDALPTESVLTRFVADGRICMLYPSVRVETLLTVWRYEFALAVFVHVPMTEAHLSHSMPDLSKHRRVARRKVLLKREGC